jgi:hypothetical protein
MEKDNHKRSTLGFGWLLTNHCLTNTDARTLCSFSQPKPAVLTSLLHADKERRALQVATLNVVCTLPMRSPTVHTTRTTTQLRQIATGQQLFIAVLTKSVTGPLFGAS